MRRFRELDIRIVDDLDPISPRIEEVKEGAIQQLGASLRGEGANCWPISTTKPKWRWPRAARIGPSINAMN
jgi:hypothetical protein